MRIFAFALVLLVSACHTTPRSVYDQDLPNRHDSRAISSIGSQLKPEDKPAWAAIVARMTSSTGAPLQSRTVGQAITRWNAQRTCLQVHAKGQDAAGGDVRARDREIDAYNDCLEMEL